MDQTVEEFNNLKKQFLIELSVQYKNLIDTVNKFPINQTFKSHVFLNLDQGIMWVQKGIELLQLPPKPEVKPENNCQVSSDVPEVLLAEENKV